MVINESIGTNVSPIIITAVMPLELIRSAMFDVTIELRATQLDDKGLGKNIDKCGQGFNQCGNHILDNMGLEACQNFWRLYSCNCYIGYEIGAV